MGRRGRSEGSIYRRSDGRWEARISLGYRGGRRIRKAFYGRTRAEVHARLYAALRDLAAGAPPLLDQRVSLAAFMRRWLDDVARGSVRATTFARYEDIVRLHIAPEIGRIALAKLTPSDVQSLLNRKGAEGLSPRTVHHIRATLRRGLQQAIRWGMLHRNAAALTDPPRIPEQELSPLNADQARLLIRAAQDQPLGALYILALTTGIRQGEALGLAWTDVNLDAGTITIRRTLQRVRGVPQFGEPKTKRSRRTLAVPELAIASLRTHRARQLEDRLRTGKHWDESELVFTTAVGTPLDATNVTHRLQRLLAQEGLPRQRFHDLRHCCASLLLAQGVHPRVVMQTLGHSQIALTMNTYSHVTVELQRDAADQMQNVFIGQP